MPRNNEEVIKILEEIYTEKFGGAEDQRFLISWADLRAIFGVRCFSHTIYSQLAHDAFEKGLYMCELGECANGYLVAVMKVATIERWRRVPKKIAQTYYFS
jgi:hypothetical protein